MSGVGEGAYQSLIPAYIETYFTPKHTSLYMGVYFSGMYIGSAIGIAVGGLTVQYWRWAYLVEMLVMLMNVVFLFVYSFFECTHSVELSCRKITSIFQNILSNLSWWLVILSYACFSFTVGAVNTWLPSLVSNRFPLLPFSTLQLDLGIAVMVASLVGALASGGIIKFWRNRVGEEYHPWMNSIAYIVSLTMALLPTYIALACDLSWVVFLVCISILLFFITCSTLPINLLIMNLVDVDAKTYSMALSICIIHVVGDIPSPIITGKIWDMTNDATLSMEISTIGFILSILLFVPICVLTYKRIRHTKAAARPLPNDEECSNNPYYSTLAELSNDYDSFED